METKEKLVTTDNLNMARSAKHNQNGYQVWTDRIRVQSFTPIPSAIEVYLDNIADRLIEWIRKYKYVVGAVAWLKHFKILEALSEKAGVVIITQRDKEWQGTTKSDEKTASSGAKSVDKIQIKTRMTFQEKLMAAYSKLTPIPFVSSQFNEKQLVSPGYLALQQYNQHLTTLPVDKQQSTTRDMNGFSIRCTGTMGDGMVTPMMHHKFLVFLDENAIPQACCSGSFNLSENASRSLENSIFIQHPLIANVFFAEFVQLYLFSETY